MTSIIESCFGPRIKKIDKQKSQSKFQQFLRGTATHFKRNLIQLSNESFCITFASRNFQSKIKYYTILDIFQSHCNIKIVPLNSYGQVIRSKQNFNKNGWIRKHINENKNKFFKVNPLTGEVHFIYSCFVPQQFNITKFWNEVIEKIAQIERQMPRLLSKIINLQGKQKPQTQIDQQTQTSKLVLTIKLAELMKENLKIEDQFNKVNTKHSQSKPLDPGFRQKFLLDKYTINHKHFEDLTSIKSILHRISKDYFFNLKLLDQNSFRTGKSNLTSLSLTKEDEQKLKSKIRHMNFRDESRWKIQQFNKEMFLIVKKEDQDTVKRVKKLLREIGNDVEYLFLDNFYDQQVFSDIIMTLALKEMPLTEFLWKNFQTISYETKFRVLIQAFNSVITLWMNNNISFESLNINSFTVTKNYQVKMKKLESARYIHPCRLQNQEAIVINNQRKEIFKELSNMYFNIFFNRRGASIRAPNLRTKNQPEYRQEDLIFESLNELTKYYYPNNLFTLIIGLNYFFIEIYRKNLEKLSSLSKNVKSIEYGMWKEEKDLKQQLLKILNEAKKGGPRMDLILAMCIQFLEEHESKDDDRIGQI